MTALDAVNSAQGSEVDAAPFDLGRLADALGELGLGEYVGCFDPLRPRRSDWEAHRARAPEGLQPLIDLFLLSRTVDPEALPDQIQVLLTPLEGLGLVHESASGVVMAAGLAVVPVFGRWLICHAPRIDPLFYFGDDTVALLARLTPKAGGRCLDLCAGPGMLALHAAGIARRVVAVERAPEAVQLARLNTRLNRLSERVEVLEGDLYAPLSGERFDTVVANPPMLPFPVGLDGPAIGHGGEDGLHLTRRVLAGLPDALHPGGAAQVIGVALGDGVAPPGVETLEDAIGGRLDLTLSVLSHQSVRAGSPYLDALVATAAFASGAEEPGVRSAYLSMLEQAGASTLCHLFIHARHGRGRVEVIDVSAANRDAGWRWRR